MRRVFGAAREIAATATMAAIVYLVIITFLAQPFQVQQVSMQPTLQPGTYVILSPLFEGTIERGDVVVFHSPLTVDNMALVKRVVGLPGDQIALRDGRVMVNGTPLDEPYLVPDMRTEALTSTTTWHLSPQQYFVMGDHRDASIDSRAFGPIDASQIIGRVVATYNPPFDFSIAPFR